DRWRGGIPSCTCVVDGFPSISSFLESCFRSSLHDGFLQISTESSYPISSGRREACFTNLLQDERGVGREVSRTAHHIPVAAGRVNIKDNVTNGATISAVDELIRQKRQITTREIPVELSISKGTVHHIIHKKLGYGKVCAQWVPKHLSENQKSTRMGVCLTQQFLH
ncbi:hypothetical protein AVEN_15797-1, partial [Araneus ventricosus]